MRAFASSFIRSFIYSHMYSIIHLLTHLIICLAYKKVFDEYKADKGGVEYRHLQVMLTKLNHTTTEGEMESIYEHLDIYGELQGLLT